MDITQNVIKPAQDLGFLTSYEARLALNLSSSTDETIDDLLEMLIKWSSDEIAVQCNRVFAKETLIETFREINSGCKRLFLTHYPIVGIDSVVVGGTTLVSGVDYVMDSDAGKLTRLSTTWSSPVVVSYTGGYDLPAEAPPALQQATLLMAREAYYATIRGDATVRMIGHKEARVIYFDPNTALKGSGGSSGGSPARRAVADLLTAYMRFEI